MALVTCEGAHPGEDDSPCLSSHPSSMGPMRCPPSTLAYLELLSLFRSCLGSPVLLRFRGYSFPVTYRRHYLVAGPLAPQLFLSPLQCSLSLSVEVVLILYQWGWALHSHYSLCFDLHLWQKSSLVRDGSCICLWGELKAFRCCWKLYWFRKATVVVSPPGSMPSPA